MSDPIDISQLVPPEPGAAPEGQPQAAPEPAPEEFYEIKYRGEVRQVPKSTIDAIAPALETTPEGVINAFQRAREADRISREKIRLEQELERLRQQNGAEYQERMGGGQAPPPQFAPQYAPQQPYQYAPPPYQQQQEEDPMAFLRRLEQGVAATQQQVNQFMQMASIQQQQVEQERRDVIAYQHAQQIEAQAERYLSEKNKGRREPIDVEDFKAEMELSGGLNPRIPLEDVMERAYSWLTRDEVFHTAQADINAKLRDPRAKVIVPAAPTAPAPPPTLEQQIGGLKLGDIMDYIPKASH